jgi:hypothetical protein
VALAATAAEELLALEGELMRREEALTVREEKARISEKALVQVSATLDMEQTGAVATQQEYLDKIQAHTASDKHILGLDKILEEKNVELDGGEGHLELRVATLEEAQAQGLNPWDNHDEPMELIELRRLLQNAEADRVVEAGWLLTLVGHVSKVLEDLGMPPILGIPLDPHMAGDVLGAMDIILECMKEAYDSGHDAWD